MLLPFPALPGAAATAAAAAAAAADLRAAGRLDICLVVLVSAQGEASGTTMPPNITQVIKLANSEHGVKPIQLKLKVRCHSRCAVYAVTDAALLIHTRSRPVRQ